MMSRKRLTMRKNAILGILTLSILTVFILSGVKNNHKVVNTNDTHFLFLSKQNEISEIIHEVNLTMPKMEILNATYIDKQKLKKSNPKDSVEELIEYYTPSEKIITSLNYTFSLFNEKMCSEKPYMILMVPSAPHFFEIRRTIRLTWGQYGSVIPIHSATENSTVKISVIFVIGLSTDKTVNEDVRNEFKKYKDIVIADFEDSYFNLTIKVLMGFKWINTYCAGVRYVHKVDDDVFLNVPNLVSTIEKYPVENGKTFGTIVRSNIHRKGKWAVSKDAFPLKQFPYYMQGTSYTITGNLIDKIVQTAQYMPYLNIEDAFITGVVASQIHNATLTAIAGSSRYSDKKISACEFIKQNRVALSNVSPFLMTEYWFTINNQGLCTIE